MKLFFTLAVVTCLLAFVVATPLNLNNEQKAKVKNHLTDCIKDENLNEDEISKVHQRDLSNPTNNLKCFAACSLEKIDILKDNEIQVDVVKTKLGEAIGEEKTSIVLERCGNIKGSDRCDAGYQMYECLENTKKELEGP